MVPKLTPGALWFSETLLQAIFVCLDLSLGAVYYPWRYLRRSRFRRKERLCAEFSDEESPPHAGMVRRGAKTCVIVGGNFGGLAALRELADDPSFRIVLIDQREYFEYTPGVLRLFCDPELLPELARGLPDGTHEFILGTATAVESDHVMVSVQGGTMERVDFDYLILAVGADYRQPITATPSESRLAARKASWQKEALRLKTASSVLILGGGAVGTELAAEIVCHFPEKRVTIVDALTHLVPLFPQRTIAYVEDWFKKRGVELVLGEMLDKWDDHSCTTKAGRVIEADLVFVCFGMRCNSQCVSAGSLTGCLGPRREVQVNEHLQVAGNPKIFAVGDVMLHPAGEIKQAYYAEMNGTAAARNVINHAQAKPLIKYPEAICGAPMMPLVYVVSLGRYDGSLGFNRLVVNGFLAALLKWVLEWTKVRQMEGRPVGQFIWALGDALTFLLSRFLFKPVISN